MDAELIAGGKETAAEPDIADLIRTGAHGEAVAACARVYAAALGRLSMAMLGSQAEAEEMVQETLLTAHRSMESYRGDGSVRAWLFGIARRKCARRLERGARRENRLRLVSNAKGAEALPDETVEKRERAHRVRHALEALRPTHREALLLRYESELSYREIGEAMGVEEAAARKRASRGLAELREIFAEEKKR